MIVNTMCRQHYPTSLNASKEPVHSNGVPRVTAQMHTGNKIKVSGPTGQFFKCGGRTRLFIEERGLTLTMVKGTVIIFFFPEKSASSSRTL